MKNREAILIAIGLLGLGISLGIFINKGLSSISSKNRTVAVRGLSEREVEANKVTWPVVYKVIGNELPVIYSQIEAGNKIVVDFLKGSGLTDADYTICAPNVVDKKADRWSTENILTRYTATSSIIVTTDKVQIVQKLIQNQGELLKKGVAVIIDNYEYSTIYEYTELNSIKPEMIAEATKNARLAAEKFAEDSGSKVGKIMNASQGQFSIENRDPYTPFIKKIRVVTSMTYSIED